MIDKVRRNRFAANLKALRTGAGLNQHALAKLLGIAQPAVARYESGVREPDLDDLMSIADKLNTTPNDLLGFAPQRSTPSAHSCATNIHTGNNSPVAIGNNITQMLGPLKTKRSKDS